MNSIASISLDFRARNESFVQELYSDFQRFSEAQVALVADRVLARCDLSGYEIEIPKLEIDLGSLPEEGFVVHFERILEEKLEEALLRELMNPQNSAQKKETQGAYLAKALFAFLLNGTLPWNLSQRYRNITELFKIVLAEQPAELSAFLRSYGHYSGLQHRLVYQLDDEQLLGGVRLIAPAEQDFIASYVQFIKTKHRQIERGRLREEERRNTAWKVVYAYLLTNQGSLFNRKLFVRGTIASLAANVNRSYNELLTMLTELSPLDAIITIPVGLQAILGQLKLEETGSERSRRIGDPAEWVKLLPEASVSGNEAFFREEDLLALRTLLENSEKVRLLIRPMKETEILELVKLLAPREMDFVTGYSDHLDRQQKTGALRGRTGGDFMHFKWQVLLPLIAASRSVSLNRGYIVWNAFRKLASHYNVTMEEMIEFAFTETERLQLGNNLRELLMKLREEIKPADLPSERQRSYDKVLLFSEILKKESILSDGQIMDLKKNFASQEFREMLLDQLSDPAAFFLLETLFPLESESLKPFIRVLDDPARKTFVEGRAAGSLRRVKWTFVFAVLLETGNQVFNYAFVVKRILEKTSAHYNLAVDQLVNYLYADLAASGFGFPFNLLQILLSLKTESRIKNKPLSPAEKIPAAEIALSKKTLLRYFDNTSGNEMLIEALAANTVFVKFISPVLEAATMINALVQRKWNLGLSQSVFLELLIRFSWRSALHSRSALLEKLIEYFFHKLGTGRKEELRGELVSLKMEIPVLREINILQDQEGSIVKNQSEAEEHQPEIKEEKPWLMENENQLYFIENAGLSLIAPFLPRLFTMLELTADGKFTNKEAQIKAIFLMQYAVFGETASPEFGLVLNKLLTNFPSGEPLPMEYSLTGQEKETVTGMLGGILQNWSKLSNTTAEGLQETFLQREGKLQETDDSWLLTVEEKSYDMLLDSLPWSFKNIKYSWMEKGIEVKWR